MSKVYKKLLPVAMILLLVLGVLGACSSEETGEKDSDSKENEKSTVEFWTIALQPTFNDYFNDLIATYEEEHPNVTIEWKDFPFDAVQNKLLTSIASKQAPDVVNLNTIFANQMASKGALVDFNEQLTDEQKGIYFDGIYSSTVQGDGAYALPWYTGIPVLYINKNLAEKAGLDINNPPQTKEELADWGKQIADKTDSFGYVFSLGTRSILEEGYEIIKDDKAIFNNDEIKEYIQSNLDLIENGVIPKDIPSFGKQVELFGSEQVAMIISSSSFINQLKTASQDVYENTIAVPAPTGKAGIRFTNTMNLVVPKDSKNVDAATEFAHFVTNDANQLAFAKTANTLPSTKEAAKDEFFYKNDGTLESQALTASVESLDKATDFYLGVEAASDVDSAINKHLQNIYSNEMDLNAELEAAEKEVNDILAR
ncbi:sugar ABC transporter substrate-binding protein [Psychrobacillus sp. NEAU-3TGS]|uniref:ABC transporter substrate-binding protein n=1 Tax=Psychrobacillus sp. NEAU-3TGS TaxID=2995412 RepID=UPI002498A585|nr:sugar ABC transporter substrate-binding protein [Psychrobacillus sp. NEAU-3TGS]MDI2587649.1 sugar ABC transporter substrate-binding protein [Psychrobacillus sp. NEAU-3TGS]